MRKGEDCIKSNILYKIKSEREKEREGGGGSEGTERDGTVIGRKRLKFFTVRDDTHAHTTDHIRALHKIDY